MDIEKSTTIALQSDRDYFYEVCDTSIDVGGDGITISYHEKDVDGKYVRRDYICLQTEMGIEIANAILKLCNK